MVDFQARICDKYKNSLFLFIERDLAAELDALEEALGVRELSPDPDPNPDDDDADKRELNTSLLSLIEKGLLEPTDLLGFVF